MEQVHSYNIIKYILTQKQYKVNNYKLQIILYLIYKDYIKESNNIPEEFDDLEIVVSKYSIKFEPIYTSLIVFGTSDFNCFNDDLILKELKKYITLPHNLNIYKLDDSLKIIIDNVLRETKGKTAMQLCYENLKKYINESKKNMYEIIIPYNKLFMKYKVGDKVWIPGIKTFAKIVAVEEEYHTYKIDKYPSILSWGEELLEPTLEK